MKRSTFFLAGLLMIFAFVGAARSVSAAALDELVAAANKEGTLEFYAPSSLGPKGAETLAKAFNKKYGTDIKVNYHPSQNMSRNVATVISRAASGVAPDYDAMVVTDAHHARLWLRKLHVPYAYGKLGVDAKLVGYDNGTVSFANQICLPAYNKKILPAKDVPKSWDDLLDPKWKGGKLGVTTATHHFSRLAVGAWGEEKTDNYVKALAKQDLVLGRMTEAYTRLLLGEIQVVFTIHDGFMLRAKKKGAPLVFADVEPVIAPAYQIGVLKGAVHPNAGHLFSAFLTSPEAQGIWDGLQGQSSALIPGSGTYKRLEGKKVLLMNQGQADKVSKLAKKYSKMLGFRKRGRKKR
jgi:iron(III) transport system substrate-binding protein